VWRDTHLVGLCVLYSDVLCVCVCEPCGGVVGVAVCVWWVGVSCMALVEIFVDTDYSVCLCLCVCLCVCVPLQSIQGMCCSARRRCCRGTQWLMHTRTQVHAHTWWDGACTRLRGVSPTTYRRHTMLGQGQGLILIASPCLCPCSVVRVVSTSIGSPGMRGRAGYTPGRSCARRTPYSARQTSRT
jgi:hypothetical protein